MSIVSFWHPTKVLLLPSYRYLFFIDLAIVRKVVNISGRVKKKPGSGSVFIFSLDPDPYNTNTDLKHWFK